MKKTIIAIMLVAAMAMQAQTSRLMFGLGGGISMGMNSSGFNNEVGPMGTFNFGYAILDSVGNEGLMLGFRTGVNATYSRIGYSTSINKTFTNYDYEGSQMDYTVSCGKVKYRQQQINLELPIMFALNANGLYVNLGAKLVTPVWNKYDQTMDNPNITVCFPEIGATVVNDPATGAISAEQAKMSGVAGVPRLFVGFSAELGYSWRIKGNNNFGFDLFVDYLPWGFGGSKENDKSLVSVDPIVNDCEQPRANVTVNPITECGGFKFQYLNAGVKLVYSFDINH